MIYSADIQKLEPGNQIRLYELDATRLGATLWRFHGHEHEGDIIWQGQLYSPIQIEASGFDIRGDGRPATPKLRLANELSGVPRAVSALCLQFKDLAGASFKVIETFKHFLDAANFDGATQMPQTSAAPACGESSRRPKRTFRLSVSSFPAPSIWRASSYRPSRSPSCAGGPSVVSTARRHARTPALRCWTRRTSLPTTRRLTAAVAGGAAASYAAIPAGSAAQWAQA